MKLKKSCKYIISSLAAIVILIPISVHAYATYNDNILENGISKMSYWVDPDASSYWEKRCHTGISNWNDTNTDFLFKETTRQSASKIDFYILPDSRYPEIGGQTQFYVGNSLVDPDEENWFWTKILLNPASLNDTTTTTDNSVATHEVGHAIGLDHTRNRNVVMHPYYDEVRVSTPQSDDIRGVNSLY